MSEPTVDLDTARRLLAANDAARATLSWDDEEALRSERVLGAWVWANRRALIAAATELHAIHATDDYQRWARAVVERDAAREEVRELKSAAEHWERVMVVVTDQAAEIMAANGRVRAWHAPDPGDALRCKCEEWWPCSTIAALDGGAAT